MKIYCAGGFLEREMISGYMRKLEAAGHEITCDWTKSEAQRFSCSACEHRFDHPDVDSMIVACCPRCRSAMIGGAPPKTSDAELTDEEQRTFAASDLIGVGNADLVWHIVASYKGSRGAYVELGYAMGLRTWRAASDKKMPVVIASGADVRKSIFHALCENVFATHDDALAWILSR